MSIHSRLNKLEQAAGSAHDSCRVCGFPTMAARIFRMPEPDSEMGECEACGRSLTPDGRPVWAGHVNRIRLFRSDAGGSRDSTPT